MREKQLKLIITFHTTAAAMAAESLFTETGLPGRLIPVPTQISAACGMAWMTDVEVEDTILAELSKAQITVDGVHSCMV